MAYTFKMVVKEQVTNAIATYFTASKTRFVIQKATAFNADASAQTLDVYIVPNGGVAGDGNKVFEAKSIGSSLTAFLSELEGHVVETNATIQAQASVNSAVTLMISGVEITS